MVSHSATSRRLGLPVVLALGGLVLAFASGIGLAFLWPFGRGEPDVERLAERPSAAIGATEPGATLEFIHGPLRKPPAPEQGYVGSAVCAECHATISQTYQSHPMAQSMATVRQASPIEDYAGKTFSSTGGRQYRVERTNEAVLHHEIQPDAEGEVIYDQAVEVHYALGSGRQGRGYLIDRGGLIFQSPISWYTHGKRWDLSPGYRPQNHPRFTRRVVAGCLECHAGRMRYDEAGSDRFADPPFAELAIGCERCHGPGQRHVAWQRDSGSTGSDPIVNPAKLEPAHRESVCNQCHLLGVFRLLHYGRQHRDFRPGQHVNEIWSIFVEGPGVGSDHTSKDVSHVGQMRASRCWQASDGRLGCISCHDAHDFPDATRRVSFYRDKCLACHHDRGCSLPLPARTKPPAGDSCIHCHMPRLASQEIAHAAWTDHRVPRDPAAALVDHRPPTTSRGGVMLFDEEVFRLPKPEFDRARGIALAVIAQQEGNVRLAYEAESLLRTVRHAVPDDVDLLDSLASTYYVQRRHEQAVALRKQVLQVDPHHEENLHSVAMHFYEANRLEEARMYLEQCLEVNPWRPMIFGLHAHVLGRMGDIDGSIKSAERGLQLDPSFTELYDWLAEQYERKGNQTESRKYRELLRRMTRR